MLLCAQVQVLQKQMNALADNQHLTDERYARTKEENAALQARVHMLEEQLRDTELRCEERLASEERRHRELVTRVDREKQLHIDNCAIRLVIELPMWFDGCYYNWCLVILYDKLCLNWRNNIKASSRVNEPMPRVHRRI